MGKLKNKIKSYTFNGTSDQTNTTIGNKVESGNTSKTKLFLQTSQYH